MLASFLAFDVAASIPMFAANCQTGNSQGGNANPQSGRRFRVRLNPDLEISAREGESLDDYFDRLVSAINLAADNNYVASRTRGTQSFDVVKGNGEELDNIQVIEDDGEIQSVRLHMNRGGLNALIGSFVENPSGGSVFITLNGRVLEVKTAGLGTAKATTLRILHTIQMAGFEAALGESFIVVHRDLTTGRTINDLGMRSTDPALVTSNLALVPKSADILPGDAGSGGPGSSSDPTIKRNRPGTTVKHPRLDGSGGDL